ncbi:tetratricopeptide repeat protein [Microbacter margulisiae]|uniref:Tetratricopeptide (TPR) repeat protein n=1 Tax=Microbacter margulisiae TaxID=1350067 RepID=A0A7W5H265_9PORP|nr:tetratricopeptide repeat protein [Microbacter margulisiae]MBB3188358.1 tetratricopeptide (TPR) repeat protein [Microbacter margulisiae]
MKTWILVSVIAFIALPRLAKSQSIDEVKSYIAASNYQAALSVLDACGKQPISRSSEYFFLRGITQLNLYRPMDAVASLKKSVAMDSLRVDALAKIAECYRMTGDETKASQFYLKAIAKDSGNIALHMEAANYFLTTNNIPLAKMLYEKMYQADSTNILINRSLAICYDDLEIIPKAIWFYHKTISANPGDVVSTNALCNILIKQKKYDEALAVTRQYRKNDSTNQRINSTNAYIYYLQNKDSVAVSHFAKCYASEDSSLFVLKYYGISCFKNKMYDKAVQLLEKAYHQDTSDDMIANYLGVSCYLSFYKAQGIYYLQKAIDLATPDSVYLSSLYFNLGKAFDAYDKSNCTDAYKAYKQAYQFNPQDGNTLLMLAIRADNCMNDKQEALRYYKIIVNMWDNKHTTNKEAENSVIAGIINSIRERIQELEKFTHTKQ